MSKLTTGKIMNEVRLPRWVPVPQKLTLGLILVLIETLEKVIEKITIHIEEEY